MSEQEKLQLVQEHALLTARDAAGDQSVRPRLEEIEAKLELSASEIAEIALGNYLKDY